MKKILLASTVALGLAFSPATAEAAPIAALIAGGLGLGSLGTAVLGAVISIGANWLIQKLFTEEPKPQGIKQNMDSGGDNPISFIVGKYATPGKLVYVNTFGNDNKQLVMVINLSEVPVTALSSKMVVNGRVCDIDFGDTDAHGFANVSQYFKKGNDYLGVRFFNDPNSAPNFLTSNFGSDPIKPWTNDMVGKGCSYVVVRCRFSPDGGVWSGLPSFKFTVQGIPLYDIRKDSTAGGSGAHRWGDRSTHEYSDNCAVISYNIIRGIRRGADTIYGGNANPEQLPYDIWAAAMNQCDENVPKKAGGTLKRFTMGAEISVDVPPLDILREIDNSCSGWTNEFGGVWKMFVGKPGASVASITDDDVIVTMEQSDDLFKPLQDTFNVAQGSYPEPESAWEMKDAPTRYFQNFIDEDGEELSLNMEFPFVWERNQVQRLMKAAVKESRRQRVHTIVLPPAFAALECWDVLTWNSSRNGYINKKFLIIQKEDLLNCCQQVTFRELDPTDYDWDEIADEFDSYDPPNDSTDPVTPTRDFTVAADYIDRPAAGKDKPAILVTWDWFENDLDIRTIQWRIRRTGKTKIIGKGEIRDYEDGEELITHRCLRFGDAYDIQFRIVPRRKQDKSDWGVWLPVTMLAIDVPANFSIAAVSQLGADGKLDFFVKATWDEVDQANNGYGIKYTIDGEDFYDRADGNRYRFPVKAPTSVSVQVRARAADGGSPGAYTDPLVLNITKKTTAPTTPTELTVVGKHRRAVIKTEDHPDADFKRWNVYYSKTNDFATGVKSKHGRSNRFVIDDLDIGDTYYFWLTAEDASGNESAKYPASNTAGVAATISKLDDDDTEDSVLAAPTALNVSQVQDTDEEGTVRTYIKMTCTAPGWATAKTTYVFEVTVGSDTYTVKSDDVKARFRVNKTGIQHDVRVRGVKGHGNKGSWSSVASITPTKKSTAPADATWAADPITPKPKFIRLKVNESTDVDYKHTVWYRNTINDSATATIIGRKAGDVFNDTEDLVIGTTYYYWAKHRDRSGNLSTNFSTVQSAVYTGTSVGVIDDGDTDSTVLAAPTALNLTKVQDTDEDGTVRTFIKMTCTPPAWFTSKSTYVFEVTVGADVYTVKSDDAKARFRVNKTGVAHDVRVRGVKGVGNKGDWSSVASLTPSKKAASAGAVTPSVHRKNGENVVKWTALSDRDIDIYIIKRATSNSYALATEIGRTKGTRWVDSDIVTKGVTYYYFIDPVDTSGNVGTASASVAQAETGIILTDTDTTTLAAPTSLGLSQANIDVNKDGTVDIGLLASIGVGGFVANAAGYECWYEDSAGQYATARADTGKWWFPANTQRSYRVRWRTISWNGQAGAWSGYTGYVTPSATGATPPTPSGISVTPSAMMARVSWTNPRSSSYLDHAYTEVSFYDVDSVTAYVATSTTNNYVVVPIPDGGNWQIRLRHVNTSGNYSATGSSANFYVKGIDTNDLVNNAVATSKLADNAVTRAKIASGAGATSAHANLGTSMGNINAGAATRTLLTLSFKMTNNATGVNVSLGTYSTTIDFENNRQMTVTTMETGGGSFSASKSTGTISNCQLSAVGVYG